MDTPSAPSRFPEHKPRGGPFWVMVAVGACAAVAAVPMTTNFLATPSALRDGWMMATGVPLVALPANDPSSATAPVDLGSLALRAAASGVGTEGMAAAIEIPTGYGVAVLSTSPRCVIAFELGSTSSNERTAVAVRLGLPGAARSASPGVLDGPDTAGCTAQTPSTGLPQLGAWAGADGYHRSAPG